MPRVFLLELAVISFAFWCCDRAFAEELKVTGVVFLGPGKEGDFSWMIKQDKYQNALFVFNDNASQYKAHREKFDAIEGCSVGGGNAVVRPFQCTTPPHAAGVPTGPDFERLTPQVKAIIDDATAEIKRIVSDQNYKLIVYSASNSNGDLGTGIFNPGSDVKGYIVYKLRALAP